MLKFLILLFVVCYVTYKLGGYVLRALHGTLGNDPNQRNFKNRPKRKTDGNVDIDYVPQDKKENKGFKGGEYVDYEEVK